MYNSFQHTFHYPTLPSAASAPVAEAAAAAAAAASHIHPHPSAGMMYSHYHGHPFRFRRFGVFRRFFWFGAGAAVATWYYNKQQRLAAARTGAIAAAADPACGNGIPPSVAAADNSWSGWHQSWHAKHDRQYQPYQQAQQQQMPPSQQSGLDHTPSLREYAGHAAATPAAAMPVAGTASAPAQAEQASQERQWGWRARRLREQREREAVQQASVGADKTVPVATTTTAAAQSNIEQDDMARIREAVDRLYAEKMRDVKSVQEQANEKAKEFARDKIDQLSVALETLRQSLKKDEETKAAVNKKLV